MHTAHHVTPTRHDFTDRGTENTILSTDQARELLRPISSNERHGRLAKEKALRERLAVYRRTIPTAEIMHETKKAHHALDMIDFNKRQPLAA